MTQPIGGKSGDEDTIRSLAEIDLLEAQILAANLELYADQPWPPGLAAALAEQVKTLRTGLGL